MKLKLVPARTGMTWVQLGIRTFFKQPLALSSLFFMYLALLVLTGFIPLLGTALSLGLLPTATLGLMVATHEAARGRFPMPSVVASAFRAGRERLRTLCILGGLYALGFLAVMGCSALVDGGQFARFYLLGGGINPELLRSTPFLLATLLAMALYLPLSLLFWHAPALAHWYGLPPLKSLFFSLVACYKNMGALTVYGLAWMALFIVVGFTAPLVVSLLQLQSAASVIMLPLILMMAAIFFSSTYFTFRDSFEGKDSSNN